MVASVFVTFGSKFLIGLTQDDLASEKVLRKQNEILTGAHRKNKNADTNPDTENEQK